MGGVQQVMVSFPTVHRTFQWLNCSRYVPELYQTTNKTGLSPLAKEVRPGIPTTLIYPIEYFPLNNPAAQTIVSDFINSTAAVLGLSIVRLNFTATAQNATRPDMSDLEAFYDDTANKPNAQYEEVDEPLINAWAESFNDRFPHRSRTPFSLDELHPNPSRFRQSPRAEAPSDRMIRNALPTRHPCVLLREPHDRRHLDRWRALLP